MVKEGVTLSRDSRSSEKLMHGIKVVLAKNSEWDGVTLSATYKEPFDLLVEGSNVHLAGQMGGFTQTLPVGFGSGSKA